MNWKWLALLVTGVCLGFFVSLLAHPQPTLAQVGKKQDWEYKFFFVVFERGEKNDIAASVNKELKFQEDGWEPAGFSYNHGSGYATGWPSSHILFKRSKSK